MKTTQVVMARKHLLPRPRDAPEYEDKVGAAALASTRYWHTICKPGKCENCDQIPMRKARIGGKHLKYLDRVVEKLMTIIGRPINLPKAKANPEEAVLWEKSVAKK